MPAVFLEVAVPVPLRQIFHYLPPKNGQSGPFLPGQRLLVPFGRQKLVGVLLGTTDTSSLPANKLKPVIEVLDQAPIFDGELFNILRWATDYYHHPAGEVFQTALPVLLRQGESARPEVEALWPTERADLDALSRAPAQRGLLNQTLKSAEGISRAEIKTQAFSSQTVRALIERGMVVWRTTEQPMGSFTPGPAIKNTNLALNAEQEAALNKVCQPGTHLLFGITGSGKTEVYLQAIEKVVIKGQQALVLVPEIGLTPQTIKRFEERFSQPVLALHSAQTDRERLNTWQKARAGAAAIIIGTRSAVFTPLARPGLIVVDEEHDASFKQQDGFRYSARDLAVLRGQREKVPVILGSATPSAETFNNALAGRYTLTRLTHRANEANLAKFELIGTQHQRLTDGFSEPLVKLMHTHLRAGNQVLVFLNRRGFAPVLLCQQCGWMAPCHRCDARMTYHLQLGRLICHHCGHQEPVINHCPSCNGGQLAPLGLGTQRLEQRLMQLFPGERVIRIDRDSTRNKGALDNIMDEVHEGQPVLLLGTQLLAKGHHFPDVTLVAVIDIDNGFFSSDYRAVERMGQLLLQVAGRAGRASKPGTVAVQTRFPDDPQLKTLMFDGYEVFMDEILAQRREFELPPFSYQAVMRAEAVTAMEAMNFLDSIAEVARNKNPTEVLGPVPSGMEKRAGKYRAQLLFTAAKRTHLHGSVKLATALAEASPAARKVRWNVDVDPYDLF